MKRIFTYLIDKQEQGMSLEEFLLSHGYSRRLIIDLKKSPAYLTLNGSHAYVTRKLAEHDTLVVTMPEETGSSGIVPTPMDLTICYEDQDLIVLNKSADLPIHPSQGNFSNTLANGMAWYFAEKGEPFVYRVINRLDRDTTGLLILAKHALSACILSRMIQDRQIHRTYLAAASGNVREVPGFSDDEILIDAPIARVNGSTIERQVDFENGEPARTHVKLLSYHEELDASILQITLETGRTHQIRVHCKYIGHPLFGDFLYHPDFRYIHRQSLHSWKLEFNHPITGKPMAFTAPIPDDMTQFFS